MLTQETESLQAENMELTQTQQQLKQLVYFLITV